MLRLVAELGRRNVIRVAAVYAGVAWGMVHASTIFAEAWEVPHWTVQFLTFLLALGFPVVLGFAWVYELTPAGFQRSSEVELNPALSQRTARRLDVTIIVLIVVLGAMAGAESLFGSRLVSATVPEQPTLTAARRAAASPKGAVSLAVLPFLDLSPARDQEFFSDGMTEEITTALAKVPDLRVVGRTSAFQFKGTNKDLRAIGQALSATHLIEGSVRKAGNRLRITAQLIKADDGTHIWAEDYDRDLTDVFAVQEDIARAITASLHMTLGLKPGENLVNNRNVDSESYEKYLQAKGIVQNRTVDPKVPQAVTLLEEVVARNPNYAPAWAELGLAYFFTNIAGDAPFDEARKLASELRVKGDAAARRALQIDANSAVAYEVLGNFAWSHGEPLAADEFFAKGLALDPLNVNLLDAYSVRHATAGRLKEALAAVEKARLVDPLYPAVVLNLAVERWLDGQNDSAIALAKTLPPAPRAFVLADIYASMGRFAEAADSLMEIAGDPKSDAATAARLLRTAPATTAAPDKFPATRYEFIYLYVGAPERALNFYQRRAETGSLNTIVLASVWHRSYGPVRRTERFKALVRKAGLVDYWRAKGWPPQCRPTTGDDFECS
ncbi:MAG TPA: hypothetical protein VFW28_09955 [Micropepsaceae bacterium]|nr:hypothetical protein [Micropepsaceae bacterium]